MSDFSFLRTGFDLVGDENEAGDDAFERNMGALLLLFAEDAMRIGGSCAIAEGRRVVTEEDVRAAMKYVARTFFESADLEARFPQACADLDAMDDESDDEGEEDDEDDEDEGDDESDEDEGGDEAEGEEDDEAEGEEDDEGELVDAKDRQAALALKAKVDACVATWHEWAPTDPAEAFLKRHIDAADAKCGYAP